MPLDVYVAPPLVPELLATPAPGASESPATVWLRVVNGAWPFPTQRTVAPAALAALDLLDHPAAAAQQQARSVLASLEELRPATLLRRDARARWRGALALAKPQTSSPASTLLPPRALVADLLEDDAAVAAHMLAVLHAAASVGASRAEPGAALDVGPERIEAGWGYLRVRAPSGLRVQRHADQFKLVTDGACASSVERYVQRTERPQPLSQAQREALAIVAYAQPVSRARIDEISGASSDAAVGFLLQRGLIPSSARDRMRRRCWSPRSRVWRIWASNRWTSSRHSRHCATRTLPSASHSLGCRIRPDLAGVSPIPTRQPLLVCRKPWVKTLAELLPFAELLGGQSPQVLQLGTRRLTTRRPSGSPRARRCARLLLSVALASQAAQGGGDAQRHGRRPGSSGRDDKRRSLEYVALDRVRVFQAGGRPERVPQATALEGPAPTKLGAQVWASRLRPDLGSTRERRTELEAELARFAQQSE